MFAHAVRSCGANYLARVTSSTDCCRHAISSRGVQNLDVDLAGDARDGVHNAYRTSFLANDGALPDFETTNQICVSSDRRDGICLSLLQVHDPVRFKNFTVVLTFDNTPRRFFVVIQDASEKIATSFGKCEEQGDAEQKTDA